MFRLNARNLRRLTPGLAVGRGPGDVLDPAVPFRALERSMMRQFALLQDVMSRNTVITLLVPGIPREWISDAGYSLLFP